jgi:hypothetical protein
MPDYDNTNRGALFVNDRKETESHPDWKGSINVNGVEYWVSAWAKTSQRDGSEFLSLSVQPKERAQRPAPATRAAPAARPSARPAANRPARAPIDDDIPF